MRDHKNVSKASANAKRSEAQRGFSIIEVMIAISILSVGILALASMQVSAMRGNSFASGVTEGSTWAADQIEKLMKLPWDDLSLEDADGDGANGLDDIGFDNNPATKPDADFRATQGGFSIHWNVAQDVVTTNTKTVNVIVTWMDHSAQKSVSMQRVVARIL
jgi:type IV pilus assembly protein PilV